MTERPKIKVQIEWGDIKHTVEGDLETVVQEVMRFAAQVLPNYSLASKLTFSPDYSSMVDDLSETVKLTPEGEAVFLKPEMSAEQSIALVLLATRVAHAVGTRFNFELQAAATEDNIVLSLTTAHSFDLADAAQYLHPATVREVLVQALLDAPMFMTRWRWVAGVALALPRFRG